MDDECDLALSVDEAMTPVVDELWSVVGPIVIAAVRARVAEAEPYRPTTSDLLKAVRRRAAG